MKTKTITKKKFVLKNRRRFSTFISILLVLSVFIVFTSTAYSNKEQQFETIKVRQGDTLWTIASEFSEHTDIRELIFNIKKENKLASSEIIAGTELKIPIQQ